MEGEALGCKLVKRSWGFSYQSWPKQQKKSGSQSSVFLAKHSQGFRSSLQVTATSNQPIKAIHATSSKAFASSGTSWKQIIGSSLNLLRILTWMLRSSWFCPLQLQLCSLGSQHLKKVTNTRIVFNIKISVYNQMQLRMDKSFLSCCRNKGMQSTSVFILSNQTVSNKIHLNQTVTKSILLLNMKKGVNLGGENQKPNIQPSRVQLHHLFWRKENKKELECVCFCLHYSLTCDPKANLKLWRCHFESKTSQSCEDWRSCMGMKCQPHDSPWVVQIRLLKATTDNFATNSAALELGFCSPLCVWF